MVRYPRLLTLLKQEISNQAKRHPKIHSYRQLRCAQKEKVAGQVGFGPPRAITKSAGQQDGFRETAILQHKRRCGDLILAADKPIPNAVRVVAHCDKK
jgi:hypothetical protein